MKAAVNRLPSNARVEPRRARSAVHQEDGSLAVGSNALSARDSKKSSKLVMAIWISKFLGPIILLLGTRMSRGAVLSDQHFRESRFPRGRIALRHPAAVLRR